IIPGEMPLSLSTVSHGALSAPIARIRHRVQIYSEDRWPETHPEFDGNFQPFAVSKRPYRITENFFPGWLLCCGSTFPSPESAPMGILNGIPIDLQIM
ncbi:MAG: hypothetical protein M3Q03_20880, partial [Chloroflexota bacterium]|nr:hypothetical protein [Chloroflexota bacterium]